MFVTNWISPTKIQKISEITNFFRHYFLSRTELKKLVDENTGEVWLIGYVFSDTLRRISAPYHGA